MAAPGFEGDRAWWIPEAALVSMSLWVRDLTLGPVFFRYAKLFGSSLRQTALRRATLPSFSARLGVGTRGTGRCLCAPGPTNPAPSSARWAGETGRSSSVGVLHTPTEKLGGGIPKTLIAQLVKNPSAMQMSVQFLGQEDLLEKGKATHSSILA